MKETSDLRENSQRKYVTATKMEIIPFPALTEPRRTIRIRSLLLLRAKVSRTTSVISALRKYRASLYQICLEYTDANAEVNRASEPYLSGRREFIKSKAPSLRYGARRYRKTNDG